MRHMSSFRLVMTALLAALICAATMMIRIPIPATGGYANPGDAIILTGAFLMPAPYCVLAAGIGSMMADVLAGYAAYAPGTLLIKGVCALIASLIYSRMGRERGSKRAFAAMLIAGVLAELFMVLGYFLYEALLLGFGLGAAGAIIGNLAQGAVGVVISCALTPVLLRFPELARMHVKMKYR